MATTGDDLFEALAALRDADDRGAARHARAWRAVDGWLGAHVVRPGDDRHREARQKTLIRVFKSVGAMKADSAPSAEGWLRRVYANNLTDEHRRHARDPVAKGLRATRSGDDDRERNPIDRLEAPEGPIALDDAELEPWIDRLLDRVDRFTEANVPSAMKRTGDQLRARVAVMRFVHGLEASEIEARLADAPARATLYKWVERGREEVLLPALEAWAGEIGDGEPERAERAFVAALRGILERTRRADAGKPRPGRRKDTGSEGAAGGGAGGSPGGPAGRRPGPAVSPLPHRTSIEPRARPGCARRHRRGEHA